jgi:MFS family permease
VSRPKKEASRPSAAANRLLEEHGIDLHERHHQGVGSEAEAKQELEAWKQELPEVPSAYQPSGVLPTMALIFMLVGAVLGAPAGALAGTIVAAIGGVVTGLLVLLNTVVAACGFVVCIFVVLTVIAAVVTVLLTFVAVGVTSALVTTSMGRLGKNRNASAAAGLSMLSAGLGLVLTWGAFAFAAQGPIEQALEMEGGSLNVWSVIGLVVGVIVAIIAAGVFAYYLVLTAKFCEDCEKYMDTGALKTLRLGGLKAMAKALAARDVAATLALVDAPGGSEAKPELFSCADCGKGYLELTAQFKATWPEKGETKEKSESWLVGSIALDADEVKRFQPHVKDS